MCAYENICREILNDTVKTEKLAKAKQTEGGGPSSKYIYTILNQIIYGRLFKQFEYIPEAT